MIDRVRRRISVVPPLAWDLLTLVAAAVATFSVPVLLSGPVHQKSRAIYRLMWLDLVGHGYRLPLDTPKPLLVLRAGLTGEIVYWLVAALAFAFLAVLFRRLGDRLFGLGAAGLVAFVLVMAGNGYVLPGPFLTGYWPLTYYTLLALGAWSVAEGRWNAAFIVVAVSGLLRPESWALAGLMTVWRACRNGGRLRGGDVLAVLAPPLAWSGFDVLLSGDPLYSFHTLQRYQAYLGLEGVGAGAYWPKVVSDATAEFHVGLLAVGLAGLLAAPWLARSGDERRTHLYFLAVVAVPALGYWLVSAFTSVIVHVRFLSPALVVLYFYAAGAPLLVLRRFAGREAAGPAGGTRDAGEPRKEEGPSAQAGSGPGVGTLAAGAAWAAAALWLGAGTDAWAEARQVAASRAEDHRARLAAASFLRERWLDGGGALLAGRSVDWFALEMGEAASRRMHQFRVVGRDAWRLPALQRGYAVYIRGDVAGHGSSFHFLDGARPMEWRGVAFLPVRRLRDARGERRLGMIHRFVLTPRLDGRGERSPPSGDG